MRRKLARHGTTAARAVGTMRSWRLGDVVANRREGLVLAGFLGASVLLAPKPYEHGLFHRPPAIVVLAFAIGLLAGVALLLFVGVLVLLLSRGGARRTGPGLATSTVVIASGLLVLSAAVRILGEELTASSDRVTQLGSSSAGQGQTALDLRTKQAQLWSQRVTPIMLALSRDFKADATFRARLEQHRSAGELVRLAASDEALFRSPLVRLRAVPIPPISALRGATREIAQVIIALTSAYETYRLALSGQGNHSAGIGRADADARRARRLAEQLAPRLYSLNPLFYGSAPSVP